MPSEGLQTALEGLFCIFGFKEEMNRFEDTAVWDGEFFLRGGEFNHGKGGKVFRILNAVEYDAGFFAVRRQQDARFGISIPTV